MSLTETIPVCVVLMLTAAVPASANSNSEIAARAATVPDSRIAADAWPFEELPPALQVALRRAVLDDDIEGALAALVPAFGGDRAAAAAFLDITLEILSTLAPECDVSEDVEWAERLERKLLATLENHATCEEVGAVTSVFYSSMSSDCLPNLGARLLEEVSTAPADADVALRIALRLSRSSSLRARLLAAGAQNGESQLEVLEAMADSVGTELARASLLEEAMAVAARTAPERHADLARRRIKALLSAGLADVAIEAFEEAPPATRRAILEGDRGPDPYGRQPDLRLDLAAASILEGDLEGARGFLAAFVSEERGPEIADTDAEGRSNRVATDAAEVRLLCALAWLASDEALPEDPFDLLAELAFDIDWDSVSLDRRTAHQALAELAERERYTGFANFFRGCFQAGAAREAKNLTAGAADPDDPFHVGFPRAARRAAGLSERLRARSDRLGELRASSASADPMRARIQRNLARPRRLLFRELLLPEGIPAGSPGAFERPPGLPLPVHMRPLRAVQEGDEAVLVGQSQALDPTGETSGGGYWIARSTDAGTTWTSLYTGLRSRRPYGVVQQSSLPLRSEDGVAVEVRVHQLDEDSLGDPAGAREVDKGEDGLYLEIPWKELERDRDGDGLTDLVEERLITDPEDQDTDGDGLSDAEDPCRVCPTPAPPRATPPARLWQRCWRRSRAGMVTGSPVAPRFPARAGRTS